MNCKNVKLSENLNKYIWKNGIRNIPRRVRISMEKKKNESSIK